MIKTNSFIKKRLKPTHILILGFLSVILIGGVLLMLPVSSRDRCFTPLVDALFTSVSATCVTGLVINDTATYWSTFGQTIIIILIQIGGLGFMTLGMFVSLLVKRAISPRERLIFAQSMNLNGNNQLVIFVRRMLKVTFACEGIGALLFSFKFIPQFGFSRGLGVSVFHSISSFCNAGFDLMGSVSGEFSSLTMYADDLYINLITTALIIIGGLGFIVWFNIGDYIRKKTKISVYTKLVIFITCALIVFSTAIFMVSEYNNVAAMGESGFFGKLLRCYFLSITFRTAGFNTIPLDMMTVPSKVLSILLMFIGGSSGSTAGGIKVSTLGILIFSVFSIARGKKEVVISNRRVSNANVLRAFALAAISMLIVVSATFFIALTDTQTFLSAAFEAFSAFGTTGSSLCGSAAFGTLARIILMSLMFFGRVGILTITYAITMRLNKDDAYISYPEAQMPVG